MKTVYLAGPISGLSYEETTGWREQAIRELADVGIKGLSPMRGKEYLSHVRKFTTDGDMYKPFSVMSSNRGIVRRDRWDCKRCDVLLVNLLGAPKVSLMTMIEIGWADGQGIPVVVVMEAGGNVHDHGALKEIPCYRVDTLSEALHIVKVMLV